MISVAHTGNQTLVRINSSSLSVIQTCMRKAQYQLVDRWKPRTGSAPLLFGHAIHKGLEVFYSHSCKERELPMNFDEVAPLLAYGHEPPESHFIYDALMAFVRDAEPLRALPEHDKRSIPSGVWTLSHYFKTYLNDAYVIHRDEKGPMLERPFSVPLWSDGALFIEWFGTIDFAMRNEASGEVLIGDHKTSSQLGADFLNRIKPNHQYTGYMLGAQRALGITSEHFMVNGIQVKEKPKTARGGPPTFVRQITRRTEQDFAEFTDAVVLAVSNYLRSSEGTGVWPIGSVDACAMWGGCPYLDVCSAPNELRQSILEAKFVKELSNAESV